MTVAGQITRDDGEPLPRGDLAVELVERDADDSEPLATYAVQLLEPRASQTFELTVPRERLREGARYDVRARVVFVRLVHVEGKVHLPNVADDGYLKTDVTVKWQLASLRGLGPDDAGFGAVPFP